MKIVCSSNMPYVREAFDRLGETLCLDGRAIGPEQVRDAEMLAIRSTTRVGADLLEGTPVRFVGTATIGTDHLDIPWLEARGIEWCYSPGCNARSVAEYITAALLCLARRRGVTLAGMTLGVIGVGNVGSRVVEQGQALGMRVLENDPPKQRVEMEGRNQGDRVAECDQGPKGKMEGGEPSRFAPLDQILAESDVVTLHVPLTREGRDTTFHLAGADFFGAMRQGAWLINAARGAVVNSGALIEAIDGGRIDAVVLDTWEGEPTISSELLSRVDLGTPHIAGHSFEGKVAGTQMVYDHACHFLGREPSWQAEPLLPPAPVPRIAFDASGMSEDAALDHAVKAVYSIEQDDCRLREGETGDATGRACHFDRLRQQYPVRREFRFTEVELVHPAARLPSRLESIGFQVRSG